MRGKVKGSGEGKAAGTHACVHSAALVRVRVCACVRVNARVHAFTSSMLKSHVANPHESRRSVIRVIAVLMSRVALSRSASHSTHARHPRAIAALLQNLKLSRSTIFS